MTLGLDGETGDVGGNPTAAEFRAFSSLPSGDRKGLARSAGARLSSTSCSGWGRKGSLHLESSQDPQDNQTLSRDSVTGSLVRLLSLRNEKWTQKEARALLECKRETARQVSCKS